MKKLIILLCVALLSTQAKAIYFDDDAIEEGYRGFADFSYTLGVGDGQDIDRVSVLTSHGYQIAPQFYAGAGFGVNYFYDLEYANMPIFLHLRSDFLNNDITPFAEVRVGYSLFNIEGFYLNPAIGCRFSLSDNIAMNVSVGYTMQKTDYSISWSSGGYHDSIYDSFNAGGIDFRIGIEF